jgi:hypothetical protein
MSDSTKDSSSNKNKIKRIDFTLTDANNKNSKPIKVSKTIKASEAFQEWVFNVKADLVTDGKIPVDAGQIKFKFDESVTPQPDKPPVNIMNFLPESVIVGQQVVIDSSKSFDSDGQIVSRGWKAFTKEGTEVPMVFDDPATTNNVRALISSFPDSESVTVHLTVTDDDGLSAERSVTIPRYIEKPLEALNTDTLLLTKEGQTVYLIGEKSTGKIKSADWIKEADGEVDIQLEDYPDKKWSKKFTSTPEMVDKILPKFRLRVFDEQGNSDDAPTPTVIQVKAKDVATTDLPIPTKIFYNSDATLNAGNKAVQSSKYVDEVMLPSGASGAKGHKINNGYLEIDTGGGNGRIYWDFHRVNKKAIEQEQGFGYHHVFIGTFVLGGENLSIKIGNHGSDGREYDGKMVFGGFGLSFHETEMGSKAEYWHNNQGQSVDVKYPNGMKLTKGKDYKFFIWLSSDKTALSTVLNVWLDFDDGKGWTKVMSDRKWTKSGWSAGNVPNGADKADIQNGPYIKCHTVWTRANTGNSKVKGISYGIPIL